jgi:trk system potassium uptake protein TrkH
VVHNRLFKGKVRELVRDGTVRFFLLLIALFTLMAFWFMGDFKNALFTVVTAITTTGFSTVDFNRIHPVALLVVMVCMIIGGMIASTAGGIKVGRFRIMLKSIPWLVKKAVSPAEAIIPLKVDGKVVDDDNLLVVHAFITIYILTLFVGTGILMVTGLSFLDSSFQMTSALGTVGLSTANVALFNPVAKVVLIIAMLFGRLEIFPILALGKFLYDAARDSLRRREEAGRKLFYTAHSHTDTWKKRF